MIEFLDATINIFENRFGLFWFPYNNGLMGKTNWASRNSLGRYFGIPQDTNIFEYPFQANGRLGYFRHIFQETILGLFWPVFHMKEVLYFFLDG